MIGRIVRSSRAWGAAARLMTRRPSRLPVACNVRCVAPWVGWTCSRRPALRHQDLPIRQKRAAQQGPPFVFRKRGSLSSAPCR
ncbi:hypothetical protein RB2654_14865 [Rhodobacterales bacterium HTCC2654]|uniref:Uncharacterized protein n=1 Tax=Maritimibacter alkaliphilus HTCC2654 TaxID=314271 RepID=A3VH22_9RHOB|nr:hypothetical protein RB2654_14865 [Rhodobacterales bacterium HTCC2654] [Maritimibacter alkaliphilus HTCC2654]